MTETPEERLATRDAAVRPVGFKAWLKTADERFAALHPIVQDSGTRIDFEALEAKIHTEYQDNADELVVLLLQAQFEWRIDASALDGAKRNLEIRTASSLDFADPAQRDARKCRFLLRSGDADAKNCNKPTVPGTVRCREHGGELVDADTRRAVLLTSYLQLVEATSTAVDVLVDVAVTSRNDLARVAAAKEILDRAGLTAELQVSVKFETEGRDERLSRLKDKLDTMQRGLQERAIDAVARDIQE
jgi:hypothetical protein